MKNVRRMKHDRAPEIVASRHQSNDLEIDKVITLFIPVRKRMMEQMETFYGDILRFPINGSEFLVNNIETVRGQLQYSEVKIDPAKNPLFQFNLASDFPEYCMSLRHEGVHFDFVAMTPGGYMASIFDPCDNSILIGCDSFESSSKIDLSSWDEYRRY